MKILVTGGCGFIGSNVAVSFADQGHKVFVLDNFSREGSLKNWEWLNSHNNIFLISADVRNKFGCEAPDVIFHFAGQVGVQSSIDNPVEDLNINLGGTFNILQNFKKNKPLIIFASTNKVYGDISVDKPVSEEQPLSFCTPYGCSKGAADQYMLDYYRVYGVPTVVLRMSCIYGKRQMGTEEQGWLCHFMRNIDNEVTLYGDGSQVRDCLYIDDYVELMHLLVKNKNMVKGQVFNVGGGIENAVSVKEVLNKIGNTKIKSADWRPSDQKYYVSDITKITACTGWKPKIRIDEGLERLKEWVKEL